MKEFLRHRSSIFCVEDSKTDDPKWKFKVFKRVPAPVVSKAVSKAVTAQAPTQATQAPAPQAPPPGTAQAAHVSPPVVSKAVTAKAPTGDTSGPHGAGAQKTAAALISEWAAKEVQSTWLQAAGGFPAFRRKPLGFQAFRRKPPGAAAFRRKLLPGARWRKLLTRASRHLRAHV